MKHPVVWLNEASNPNFTLLGSLEVSHYYHHVWVGMGVQMITFKTVLSSAGLAYWTGTELGKNLSDPFPIKSQPKNPHFLVMDQFWYQVEIFPTGILQKQNLSY